MAKLNAYMHITRRGKVKRNPAKKIHITKRYVRVRIREPSRFIRGSFRTLDTGRLGHMKMVRGRLKSTGKWELQAVLFSVRDILRRDADTLSAMKNMGLPVGEITTKVDDKFLLPRKSMTKAEWGKMYEATAGNIELRR